VSDGQAMHLCQLTNVLNPKTEQKNALLSQVKVNKTKKSTQHRKSGAS
jgi:hypothetical protein